MGRRESDRHQLFRGLLDEVMIYDALSEARWGRSSGAVSPPMTDAPGGSEPNLVGWWSGDGTTRDLARGMTGLRLRCQLCPRKSPAGFLLSNRTITSKFLPLPTFTLPAITVALMDKAERILPEPSVISSNLKDHDGWQLQIEF